MSGDITQIRKNNDLNIILNQKPKAEWVKEHPIIKIEREENGKKVKAPLQYMSIERVEYLLTAIFGTWNTEIKSIQMIANSICVTVRLFYKNPATEQMEFQDGVGAVPLQVNKDKSPIDWNEIKSNAVQIGAPAAESFAVKDAAHKIGKIFGKELNRRDNINYIGALSSRFSTKEDYQKKISELLSDCHDEEKKDKIMSDLMEAESTGKNTVEFYEGIIGQLEIQIS